MIAYLGSPTPTGIPDAEFSAIPTGLAYFPDGMIVQDESTSAVAIIQGGANFPLSSQVLAYLGNPAATPIPDAEFSAIPAGLAYFPDSMIVQDGSGSGSISIIQGGQKRLLSAGILQYLGSPQPTVISDDQYLGIPTGLPYVPEGLFVSDAGSGAIDIIQNGQKHLVSPQVDLFLALCRLNRSSPFRRRSSMPSLSACSTTPKACSCATRPAASFASSRTAQVLDFAGRLPVARQPGVHQYHRR